MDSKTLKVLKAEAKAVGLKNYSKLTREELIQKTADKVEQNALASSLSLSTLIKENKTVPEPLENKNEPEPVENDPNCSLILVHIDKPAEPVENKNEPEPVENKNEPEPAPPVPKTKRAPAKKKEKKEKATKAPAEKKEKKKTGPNKWQEHVKAYREAHPDLSYKQAMIDAKQTYKTE